MERQTARGMDRGDKIMSDTLYKCQQCDNLFNEDEIIFITIKNDFVICDTCITKGLVSQKRRKANE